METEHLYDIIIYTENQVGLLSSIAGIFTRRSLNIDYLMAHPSQIPGVHKIAMKTRTTEERIRMVALQIEKKVDVIKAFYYIDEEHSEKEIESVTSFLDEREKKHNK